MTFKFTAGGAVKVSDMSLLSGQWNAVWNMDGKWAVHVYPFWKEESAKQRSVVDLNQSCLERNLSRFMKAFKSCRITNALDSSEDDAVWDKENEETEDAQEIIDIEFKTNNKGEEVDKMYLRQYKWNGSFQNHRVELSQ